MAGASKKKRLNPRGARGLVPGAVHTGLLQNGWSSGGVYTAARRRTGVLLVLGRPTRGAFLIVVPRTFTAVSKGGLGARRGIARDVYRSSLRHRLAAAGKKVENTPGNKKKTTLFISALTWLERLLGCCNRT
ncbi:hypothetical protein NDU88_003909 [Pleurodeles waltl]|uniref:Uncharacterized protein n=1 Tax=Pleurodeles waltl TaxID=8319 RepID=A0AAV7KYS0_PLEWA|nr:hypothetical protein NDU88_003909 [Pleurodeles waltl]